MVSTSHGRSARQKSARSIIDAMFAALLLLLALQQQQPPPVPQPFPRPGTPPARPSTPPAKPATPNPSPPTPIPVTAPKTADPETAPTEATLGVPIYPGSQFIRSYDAGRGQRFYIFGTAAGFTDLVTYYRSVLKQKGELVFDAPATHEFDVGKYNEDTMAFPPGVTVKDFQSD